MIAEVKDMKKHERRRRFFLPRDVSAKVARRKEPRRQPRKKED